MSPEIDCTSSRCLNHHIWGRILVCDKSGLYFWIQASEDPFFAPEITKRIFWTPHTIMAVLDFKWYSIFHARSSRSTLNPLFWSEWLAGQNCGLVGSLVGTDLISLSHLQQWWCSRFKHSAPTFRHFSAPVPSLSFIRTFIRIFKITLSLLCV